MKLGFRVVALSSAPALLFAYEPGAMRLDHFLAIRGPEPRPPRPAWR